MRTILVLLIGAVFMNFLNRLLPRRPTSSLCGNYVCILVITHQAAVAYMRYGTLPVFIFRTSAW
jgi:hypothetical protein